MNENILAFLFLLIIFSPVIYQLTIVIKEHDKERKLAIRRLKNITRICLLIFIPITISVAIISHTNYLDYESPIPYDRYDEITFKNFRGIELFRKTLYGNERFAYVVTSIDSNLDDSRVTIQALFHPSRSFVYDKYTNSKDLLTHEKYHFKITEIFARKVRKQIANLESVSKEKIKQILSRIRSEEILFQKKYDYDTYHSYIFSEQKKYERRIDSLLSLLADYKNPTIIFNEKD